MSDKKKWPVVSRKDYMDGKSTHHDYFMAIAQLVGINGLKRLVGYIATPAELKTAMDNDRALNRGIYMNDIKLERWDRCHNSVRELVAECGHGEELSVALGYKHVPGRIIWSISDSVCVLKAVAREMIESEMADVKVESGATAELAKGAVFTSEMKP